MLATIVPAALLVLVPSDSSWRISCSTVSVVSAVPDVTSCMVNVILIKGWAIDKFEDLKKSGFLLLLL